MVTIFFRTILIYLILVGVMRLMGKRQIGELDLSELITTLLLSELAVTPISDNNTPLLHAIAPIIIVISLEIFFSFIVTKSNPLKTLFGGRPSYIIRGGQLDQKELSRLRPSIDELIGEARLKDIGDISEVNYAILERNGRLSIFPKTTLPPSDPNVDKGVAHPMIIDGKVSSENLERTGHTEAWLLKRISDRHLKLSDVFLFTVDDAGGENLIYKYRKEQEK